jgi:protein-S-isoprenylcysteine O-methyltransferase Ste14
MLRNRIPPPILAAGVILAMGLTAGWPAPSPLRWTAAGLVFLIAGAFGLPALRAFRRAGTTIDPVRIDQASALVTTGSYRLTRNPMYVSLVLMLVAWALFLGEPWVWFGPALLALWLDRLQIRPEEDAMATRFGAEYAAYRARVRRWL